MKLEVCRNIHDRNTFIEADWDSVSHRWKHLPGDVVFASHFAIEGEKAAVTHILCDFDMLIPETAPVLKFVSFLQNIYEVDPRDLSYYFSGRKGFHVCLPMGVITGEPVEIVPLQQVQKFAARLAKAFPIDMSLYRSRQIVRQPDRINADSGLYKVELAFEELKLPMETIKEIALRPRGVLKHNEEPTCAGPLKTEWLVQEQLVEEPTFREERESVSSIFRPAPKGQRNSRATVLAGYLFKVGVDLTAAQEIMALWNRSNRDPLETTELRGIVTRLFNRNKQTPKRNSIYDSGF